MKTLDIRVTQADDRATVVINGELDEAATEPLKDIDLDHLSRSGCQDLAIDLGGVEFIDSSGIGALVGLRNRAAREGLSIRIDQAPLHVRRTLTVAGLDGLLGLT
ncbi:STAS domain-containing protein [uncultured Jatrophihabitans sp.]|uniref:STAS domain-containing protein n=1 Tax=uncultured Jatrophihabitans sp. TaxID=1610747 RepID=UPI0035CB74AC